MACDLELVSGPLGTFAGRAWLDQDLIDGYWPDTPCVLWSGSRTGSRFEPGPANWLPDARAALTAALERMPEHVLVRPHWAQLLNDVPGTRSALQAVEGGHRLALDVAALLAPSMVASAAEHIERIMMGLGGLSACVLLTDVRVEEDVCRAVPLGGGSLPGQVVGEHLQQWVPDETPICVWADDEETARQWLAV
ncbi:MAG: hypothetical protein MK074_04065 [Phycisphaerales bacterium]|nr:hypothetical protein [Phycisphaerales bacterium]